MDDEPTPTTQSDRRLRVATSGALAFLWIIVVTGATVRLTGSGLGCPDWPTCNGARPVPEAEFHGMIEFGNRLVSTPTTFFVLWSAWLARRKRHPTRSDIRFGTWGMIVGVVANIILGAVIIKTELPPELVSAHFVISIWTLFAGTLAWYAARRPERISMLRSSANRLPFIGAITLLTLAALTVLAGVLTTASGPHSGSTDVAGGVDRLGIGAAAVMFHARLAYVFAGAVVLITVWLRRNRAGWLDLGLLALLVLTQISLGEYQYRNGLPWEVVLAHVSLAALVWIVTCRVAIDAATRGESRIGSYRKARAGAATPGANV